MRPDAKGDTMKRCVPIALLLVLGSGPAAVADTRFQVVHAVYGCVDPRATLALAGRDGRLHQDGWAASVRQGGRCFRLTPALRLEVIMRTAGLALVRRVPPRVGEPPIYVLAGQLRTERQQEPSHRPKTGEPVAAAPTASPLAPPPAPTNAPPATSPPAEPARPAPSSAPPAEPAPAPADATGAAGGFAAGPVAPAPSPVAPAVVPPVPPAAAPPAAAPPAAVSPAPSAASGSPSAGTGTPAPSQAGGTVAVTPPLAVPAAPAAVATDTPAAPAPWPPRQAAAASGGWLGIGGLIAGLVTLLLLAFVAAAFAVARRRRHFAHVEEGWPSPKGRVAPPPAARPAPRPDAKLFPTPQAFRRHCAGELERAGWVTQLAFPGDGSGPDIVCRRAGTVLAVRCRLSPNDITSEMVDEAHVMGTKQAASVTMLASNAPFSQRARDEAIRHRVHLLRDNELSVFVG